MYRLWRSRVGFKLLYVYGVQESFLKHIAIKRVNTCICEIFMKAFMILAFVYKKFIKTS